MDTTSLLIKLNELAPEFNWQFSNKAHWLQCTIVSNIPNTKNFMAAVASFSNREDYYKVFIFSGSVAHEFSAPSLETTLDESLKMAFNITMANIIYDSKESHARWVESVNQSIKSNSLLSVY